MLDRQHGTKHRTMPNSHQKGSCGRSQGQSLSITSGSRSSLTGQARQTLFLPEASDYIGSSPAESISLCKPVTTSPFVLELQAEARKHSLPINVGIHEPSDTTTSKIRNTLIYIDETGKITQRYQKLHLFDLDLSRDGGSKMKESDTIEPGAQITAPFTTPVGKLGMTICFDLRFPELSLSLRRQGAEIIAFPSAFMPSTGKAHWHALLRARAIETESYVFAAGQVGAHNEKRTSYGHSLVISPWGEVLAELGSSERKEDLGEAWEPEIAVVDIDLENVERMRRELPLARRTYVYLAFPMFAKPRLTLTAMCIQRSNSADKSYWSLEVGTAWFSVRHLDL